MLFMKKTRVLILFLVTAMLFGVLSSCTTSADEITVTLQIIAGDDEILDADIKLSYADPTVLMLVSEAAALYEINVVYNADNDSVLDIGDYKDQTVDNVMYFWEYYINGVLPENTTGGKAKDQAIKDGDVITYMYASYDMSTATTK